MFVHLTKKAPNTFVNIRKGCLILPCCEIKNIRPLSKIIQLKVKKSRHLKINELRSLKQQYPAVVKNSVVVYRYNLGKLAKFVTTEKTKRKNPERLALIRDFLTLRCQTQNESGSAAAKPRLRPTLTRAERLNQRFK